MNYELKRASHSITKADPEADLALINQYSLKELTAEDVFCFNVVLCDNEVDRDLERFTDESLDTLAKLFVGKTGIKDHNWRADNQIARLYRVEIEEPKEKNSLGQPLKRLRGSAYMLRNDESKATIESIEGGILKEVSVGFATKSRAHCSLCGEELFFSWGTGRRKCKNDHVLGEIYNGVRCIGELKDPDDAYEFSFVAVPAQRGAGATKGLTVAGVNIHEAFMKMSVEDISDFAEENEAVIKHLQMARLSAEEREKRKAIREFAEKI